MPNNPLLIVVGVAFFGLALGAGCDSASTGGDGSPDAASPAGGATERCVVTVRGMTCQGCVDTVTRAVEALPGVEKVEVSLENEQAVVTRDPKESSAADIVAAITQAGYEAEPGGEDAAGAGR